LAMMDRRSNNRWHVMDIVTEYKSGRLSETKIWANIGKAVMTWGFIYVIMRGGSSEFLWLAYGGIVVAHEVFSKAQNQKQQALDKPMTRGEP